MNHFAVGIRKFEISASPVKSESQRNASSDPNSSSVKSESQRNASSDPNSSSVKSETQRNTSSDPESISLPCRLYECKCRVVVVQDLLKCGVLQLEGTNRNAYCLFFGKDFLSRSEAGQKLSSQVPVGTVLLANARLIKENSLIPFLATSIWEDGAIPGENQLFKLFSNLESRAIEQYNMLSRDLEWLLPREDSVKNNIDKDVTDDDKVSNNNSIRTHQGQSRNISPRYRQKRSKSPGHSRRIKSRSRRPTYHRSQTSSRTRSPEKGKRESSVTNAKRKQDLREISVEKKIKNEIENKEVMKQKGAERSRPSRTRSRSPRRYPGRTASHVFSDDKKIKNKVENMEVIKTEGADRSRPSRTRSRSQRRYPGGTESRNPRYRRGQEQEDGKSSPIKYQRKEDLSEFSVEKKIKIEIKDENMGGIKTEAADNYKQQLKKCENQSKESIKLKQENKESEFGFSITKEKGDSISMPHSCCKGSSNEDGISRNENIKAIKDNALKVLNKKTAKRPKPTMRFYQLISDHRGAIFNGKGKILRILNSNYGIAIVFGFGGLCKVLFDIFDVMIDSQVCADLGKTLYDVMKEGDLVCLHAICIENSISSTDNRLKYMATAVARANSIEALLNMRLPAAVNPPSLEEMSQEKIKNFHQVAEVVLATQNDGPSFKIGIPVGVGILWRKRLTRPQVDFYCFHCKLGHDKQNIKKVRKQWEVHNKHVLTCKDLNCRERGKKIFERMRKPGTKEQAWKEKRVNPNMATEEQVLQAKEFNRLKKLGNAGKSNPNKLHCFHCQYEGGSMSHFTSTKHQDHVKDCGTKILDCPENPKLSSAVQKLICWREVLFLPKENHLYHLYHRYFCLHCKEPFSDKRHIRGVNHSLHMAKDSCDPTCKSVLLDDEKYVSGCGKGGKWCFICNVKLESKSIHESHIRDSRHSHNVFNLLKKKEHTGYSKNR